MVFSILFSQGVALGYSNSPLWGLRSRIIRIYFDFSLLGNFTNKIIEIAMLINNNHLLLSDDAAPLLIDDSFPTDDAILP